MNEILSEELDAVRAILMDGIEVWDDGKAGITTIIISLHPLTANEDERSYVSLTLEIAISAGYPDVAPDVAVSTLFCAIALSYEYILYLAGDEGPKGTYDHSLGLIIVIFAIDFETQGASGQQRGRSIAQTVRTP